RTSVPRLSIGPTIMLSNGVSGDGQFEVAVGRGGETSTMNFDPPGSPGLQNVIREINHYVDVGADGGAVQLGATAITQEPTAGVSNTASSKGSFIGQNGTITWEAIGAVGLGASSGYLTVLSF